MPKYTYRARDKSGQLITGEVESDNEQAVASNLKGLGYSIIQIAAKPKSNELMNFFSGKLKGVSRQEIIVFTRQLATLIRTGNTLIASLDSVTEQIPNPVFKEIVKQVAQSVQGGLSFSEAAAKYPKIFDSFFVSMVRVGEAGGLLDEVLERLASLGTQELEVRTRLQSALTYPIALVLLSFVVVSFILIGVLPNFTAIFEASQAKLPIPTRIILGLSLMLKNFWYIVLGILIALAVWAKRYASTVEGRETIDRDILKIPVFGQLYLKVMISRFSRGMAALTKSGIPFIEGLEVVEKTIPNSLIRRTFEDVRRQINVGQNVTEAFKTSGVFPPMVIQLINAGERSGKLDEMFSEIASFYEPEVEYALRNLTSLLEPFLLLLMGGIVGFIALSVLLPIFNLIKVIKS
ncbi:MAG: type II secretion system F family protein [Candidatus Omnitrophota bacterium]